MHFHIEQHFDLPLESVESALHDPRFVEAMAALPSLGRPELLSQDQDGTVVHQRVRYAFAGELSSAVRAVIDPTRLTWVEDATIDLATHHTDFTILPDNYASKLRCQGTFDLSPEDDGCRRVAEGELRVSAPLVAGRVERAIVSGLEEHARAEVALVQKWVAGATAG